MKGRQINPAFFNQSDSERNEVGVGKGRRDMAVGVKVKDQSLKAKFRAARAQGINYN